MLDPYQISDLQTFSPVGCLFTFFILPVDTQSLPFLMRSNLVFLLLSVLECVCVCGGVFVFLRIFYIQAITCKKIESFIFSNLDAFSVFLLPNLPAWNLQYTVA